MEDVSNFFKDISFAMGDTCKDGIKDLLAKYDKYAILNRMHGLMYYLQEDYKKIKNKNSFDIMTILARIINECEGRKLYFFNVDELIEIGGFISEDPLIMDIIRQVYGALLNKNGIVPYEFKERYDLMTRVHYAYVKDEEYEVFYEINTANNREMDDYEY